MLSFLMSNGSFVYCDEEGTVTVCGDGRSKSWKISLDEKHPEYLTSAAVSNDGTYLVCCSNMGQFQIYYLANGLLLYSTVHYEPPTASEGLTICDFSPAYDSVKGCQLLICLDIPIAEPAICTFQLTECKSGLEFQGGTVLKGHNSNFVCAAFSPEGHWVVTGSRNGMVRAWETSTGRELVPPLAAHTESVTSVAFSPDSKRVASGSLDNTVAIWDTSAIIDALE